MFLRAVLALTFIGIFSACASETVQAPNGSLTINGKYIGETEKNLRR